MTVEKIKIIHVFSLPLIPFSGSRNYLLNLLPRFSQHTYVDIRLVVEKDKNNYLTPLKKHNIPVIEVNSPKYSSWKYFSENKKYVGDLVLAYMNTINPLIKYYHKKGLILNIHHVTYLLPYLIKLSKIHEIPNVVTVHGTGLYELKRDSPVTSLFFDDIVLSAQYVDKFIVPSYFMLDAVKKTLKVKKDQITVIYPGVDLNEYSPTNFSESLKRKFNDFVLYFGRIEKEKGIDLILNVAELLPKVSFVMCGRGKDSEYLKNKIQIMGLKNVKYLGFVSRNTLKALIATANLTILPSIWDEPFPLVPLESISSGTPVIVSSRGGLNELPRDKGIIVLHEITPEKLAEAIVDNLYIKNEASIQLREIAKKMYSWEHVVDKYLEVYYRVI